MVEQAAIVATAIIERQIFFKTDCPSIVELTPLRAAGLKSAEKWQKRASDDHGILHDVIFVMSRRMIRKGVKRVMSEKKIMKSNRIRTFFASVTPRNQGSQN
jgi:hypothetical protein